MATKTLPWEIIMDILSRMGVKDLLRFRCVAKPWCSLIDGPDFINLHLNRSLKTGTNLGLILGYLDLCWVDLDALDSADKLSSFSISSDGEVYTSTCNGLVVLENTRGEVSLLNPSTQRLWKIPISDSGAFDHQSPYRATRRCVVGFGYDPVGDDYKLLRITYYFSWQNVVPSSFDFRVYRFKSMAWKRVRGFKNHLGYREGNVIVNDALHWAVVAHRNADDEESDYVPFFSDVTSLIVAFDLVTDEYREVPMPATINCSTSGSDGLFHVKVATLKGWLCVVFYYESDALMGGVGVLTAIQTALCSMKTDRADVWAMKEYGVESSWTKLFSVAQAVEIGLFYSATPLAYLKAGDGDDQEVVMNLDGRRLAVYDVGNGRFRELAKLVSV